MNKYTTTDKSVVTRMKTASYPASIRKHIYGNPLYFQLAVLITAVLVMSAFRLLLYVVNSETYSAVPLPILQKIFIHGIRFDAAILGMVISSAFLISFPFTFYRTKTAKILWLGIVGAGILTILAISFGDIFYSQHSGKRLSYEISVFFTSQALPLIVTAISDFPVLFPFSLAVIGIAAWIIFKLHLSIPDDIFSYSGNLRSIASLIGFIIIITLITRGGTQGRPIRIGDGLITENPLANQLVVNAPFLALKSIEFGSHKMPQLMPKEEAFGICRDYLGQSKRFVSDTYPFLRVPSPPTTQKRFVEQKPNILVFLLESWSKKYIADSRYAYLTPNFQKLRSQGLWFPNAYTTGTRSPNGVYSLVTGFPDFIQDTVMRRPQLSTDFFSIADVFKAKDYATYFIHGGNLDFDNLEGFLRHQGFNHLYGKRDFKGVPSKTWWGTPDGAMYDLALKVLERERGPFFSLFFTTSTHGPYNVPDGFRPVVEVDAQHPEADYLRALHYADHELGRFLEQLRQRGVLDNSIIVLTADHTHHYKLGFLEDKEIPLVFYGPNFGLSGTDTRLVSLTDILPSVTALIGFDDISTALGRNLFEQTSTDTNYVYWISGPSINLRWDDYVVTQTEDNLATFRVYDAQSDFSSEMEVSPDTRQNLQSVLYAMYECSTRPVLDDRVYDHNFSSD